MFNKRNKKYEDIFRMTNILVQPKLGIPTFGNFDINYYFLASLDIKKTKLREGVISFQKPRIILSQEIEELFEGFGSEVEDFINEIYQDLKNRLRILGYNFKHNLVKSKTFQDSFSNVLKNIKKRAGDNPHQTILTGIDSAYELSILKFTIELIERSFQNNITELEERGFFNPQEERTMNRIKIEIENLFKQSQKDPSVIKLLGRKLKEYNLFSSYEDRFFSLVTKSKR